MKKIFTLVLVLIATVTNLLAYDFQSGDLYYNITSDVAPYTVEVTYEEFSSDNYSSLTTATIPASVTYNGITYSVTSIGDRAFRDCTSLTSITIPNSVTSIGEFAFSSCSALTSITIPNSVTSIGDDAFDYCSSLPVENNLRYADTYLVEAVDKTLSTYSIKEGTKWIGNDAFYYCSSLTSITIPNSVTSIGWSAFSRCSALTSVTIGNNVAIIDWYAFYNCSSLTSITIPNSVTSIKNQAFQGCSSLTSVTIGNNVTLIDNLAFFECSSLDTLRILATTPPTLRDEVFSRTPSPICYIPCGTKSAYEASDWASQVSEFFEEHCPKPIDPTQITYTSTDGNIVTPNRTDVFGANIVSNEYKDGQGVITFDGPVTSIGDSAFLECAELASIAIPESVTTIGYQAFLHCNNIASITIPNGVTDIEEGALAGCPALGRIIVENGNPIYDSRDNCNAIVETATNTLIAGCKNTIIPNTITTIGKSAFWYCSTLTSITIPSSVKTIAVRAFVFCPSLTSIKIPKSVTKIEHTILTGCNSATSIVVEEGNPNYDSRDNCNAIIETATNELLNGCQNTIIPNSVSHIREYAFAYSTYPSIVSKATTPPIVDGNAFHTRETPITVYIPCGTRTAYEASDWAQYVGEFVEENCAETEENDTKYTITYTSTDGKAVTLNKTDGFGANIISNTYDDTRAGVITFDAPVTTIGASAFEGCTTLRSIIIPNSVKSIEEDAFAKCSALRDVSISASVTTISTNPFTDCVNLASITVEEGNTVYDSRNDCNAIIETASNTLLVGCKSTIIPEDVKKIGYSAFYGCINLKAITIPTSVELVERAAFHNTGITSITIPANTTLQGGAMVGATIEGVFTECKELESVSIEAGLSHIPSAGFGGCTKLSVINIPNTVESIGRMAFFGCSALKSITFPQSVTSLEDMAFGGCSSLKAVNVNAFFPPALGNGTFTSSPTCTIPCGTITLYQASDWNDQVGKFVVGECAPGTQIFYTSTDGNIVTPNRTNGFGANFVSNVYVDGVGIITFDDKITSVGEWSFYACHSLASITLPETVTMLDRSAFESCTSLESVTLPSGLKTLGDFVFYNNQALQSITIPATVTNMGQHVFGACTALKEVYVEAVTPPTLGGSILSGASKPTCYIPCGTLDAYEASAWAGQVAEFVDKCAGGTNIITYTASNDSVVVPHKTDAFGAKLISNTYVNGVGTLTFDAPVTKIGNEAFSGCYRLATIDIPFSVETIGSNAFTACTDLQTIDIPNTVTSIQKLAFFGCSSMTDVRLSDHITEINSQTFASCSALKSITIPAEVNKIDARAFKDCIALTQIISEAETPPSLALNVFDNVSTSIPVYVPCGTVEDYKKATRWKKFTKIQEHPAQYKVTLLVNDAEMGTAKIGEKNTFCGTDILAESNEGYHFEKWSDNMTDSVRTLELTSDTTLTAYFGKNLYTISTQPDDATHGVTYGDTTAAYKDIVTISAEANLGWRFVAWHDQITDNPRQVEVIADSLFVALFEEKQLVYDTTYIYTCAHKEFTHPVTGAQILMSDAQQVFTDSVVGANEDTLYVYIAIPVVEPEAMTATILKNIDAVPTLLPGMLPDTDASLAAIRRYYDANDTESIADVLNAAWKTTVVPCDANSHTMTLVVETECDDLEEFSFTFPVEQQTKTITENATACGSYTWVQTGVTYTATGIYEHTETSKITGCDSVYHVLYLTINHPTTSEITEEACGSYVWNNQTYTQSGNYTFTTVGANGCDSTVTLHLTVWPEVTETVENVEICYGESYVWQGKTYTTSTTQRVTLEDMHGCDSVVVLHLTVLPEVTETIVEDTICYGEDYFWLVDGNTYTGDVVKSVTLEDMHGCDSVVTLHLTMLPEIEETIIEDTICYGETYKWSANGKTYTGSTTASVTLYTADRGCDSVVTLHLTMLPKVVTLPESATICHGESYYWNGTYYTSSGIYTVTLEDVHGCDSVATLNLTVLPAVANVEESATICYGESYQWSVTGKSYNRSGDYSVTLYDTHGCAYQSILHLTVLPEVKPVVETATICYGESYKWSLNNTSYSASGDYTITLQDKNGCDYQATLHLTVLPEVADVEESATICYGETYTWNGKRYSTNGDYTVTLYDKHGCDYEATLHLTVLPKSQSETTIETCDSYTWNGRTYYESGDYTYVTNNVYGCDSTAILHLTIHHSEETHLYENACDSYTWSTTGETYTESGTYYAMLETSHGCDSIVVLHLTMLANEGAPEYVTICYGETYEWNGQVYDQTGNYSITLTNIYGCDSTAYLYLTILPKMRYEYEEITVCPSELPFLWNGLTLTEAGEYRVREQYTHYDCDRTEYVLTLHVYNFSAPAKVTMPRAICGNPVDVTAATAEIEAYLDAQDLYAPNATVVWQIKNNGRWEAKIHEPVKGSMSEVTVRYVIYSDCGSLQSPEMTVPVEMPTPENDVDMDGISIQSLYGNRIFMLDLNGFVAKFGWKPEPEQVTWYQAVGAVDTYGEQGDDIAVGTGHSYNLPGGAIIVGNYYVVIERIDVSDDDCAAVYRSIVISSVNATSAPRLVPNAVRPSEMMTIKDLDPNQVNEIYVYSTTGELLATYTAEKVREFMLRASHTTGYYIIDVVNNEGKHTLKYIVR